MSKSLAEGAAGTPARAHDVDVATRGLLPDPEPLIAELEDARAFLLHSAARLPEERWAQLPPAGYSPVGWHVGHAAATLARWLLPGDAEGERFGGFFDPTRTGKTARTALPSPQQLRGFLARVSEKVAGSLRAGRLPRAPQPGLPAEFLVHHLAQHGLQHGEHVAVITALLENRLHRPGFDPPGPAAHPSAAHLSAAHPSAAHPSAAHPSAARIELAGGEVWLGALDSAEAYDNERGLHRVQLEPCWLDRSLVTVREYASFVAAGGYREERLWSPEGWALRCRNKLEAPLGWQRDEASFAHPDGAAAAACPVTGICWFEADAFARARGARLPTEAEREAACAGRAFPGGQAAPSAREANVDGARGGLTGVEAFPPAANGLFDLAGNVWEWTSSSFEPFPGFTPYPYDGYSTPWFGGTHRVLRGGSWATSGRLCRSTFRNWYEPGFRELPAGLRCAGSL